MERSLPDDTWVRNAVISSEGRQPAVEGSAAKRERISPLAALGRNDKPVILSVVPQARSRKIRTPKGRISPLAALGRNDKLGETISPFRFAPVEMTREKP